MPDPTTATITTNRELLAIAIEAWKKLSANTVQEYRVGSITYRRVNLAELWSMIERLQRAVAYEDTLASGGPFQHSQARFGGRR